MPLISSWTFDIFKKYPAAYVQYIYAGIPARLS